MLVNDLLSFVLRDSEVRDRQYVGTVMWCLLKPGNVDVLRPCIAVEV